MRTLGINQLMSVSLYGDDSQLDSFMHACVEAFCRTQQLTLVGDLRAAFAFGRQVHADTCTSEWLLRADDAPVLRGECASECGIDPCAEIDADVVMMRVEFDVEGGDSGDE